MRRGGKTIADHAIEIMREREVTSVSWGDGILVDIGHAAGAGGRIRHPLRVMGRVLDALDRDDRFAPGRIKGHDRSGRPRWVRHYRLRESS